MAKKQRALGAALLLLTVLVLYQPSLENGFVWDDDLYVVNNTTLRSTEGLKRIWFARGATMQYYPMTFSSFWLEYRLFGQDPAVFHATNMVLHAANSVLVWLILMRLGIPLSWLVALVFAAHPVNVESVAWISERKNVLSALFALGSLYLLVTRYLAETPKGEKATSGAQKWRGAVYCASFLLFILALLSKSVTCMMPVAFLFLYWWKRGKITRKIAAAMVPFLVAGIAAGINTQLFEKTLVGASGPEWDLHFWDRFMVAGRALWFYPFKLLWPSKLCFIYPRWNIDPLDLHNHLFPLAAIAVMILLWTAKKRIGRGAFTAAAIYVATIFPALGFIDYYPMMFSFVADHFLYLAQLPLLAGAAWAAKRVAEKIPGKMRLALLAAFLCATALLGVKTRHEQGKYKDLEALWSDTIAKNPTCWMAYNNLGCAVANRGEEEKALPYFNKALEIYPGCIDAANNLFAYYRKSKQYDMAIALLKKLLVMRPDSSATIYYNLACAYSLKGKIDTAIFFLDKAVKGGVTLRNLLKHDKDLENIRDTGYYKRLIEQIEQ